MIDIKSSVSAAAAKRQQPYRKSIKEITIEFFFSPKEDAKGKDFNEDGRSEWQPLVVAIDRCKTGEGSIVKLQVESDDVHIKYILLLHYCNFHFSVVNDFANLITENIFLIT